MSPQITRNKYTMVAVIFVGALLLVVLISMTVNRDNINDTSGLYILGTPHIDKGKTEASLKQTKEMFEIEYQLSGILEDVTAGKALRQISTNGVATGFSMSKFVDNQYFMLARINNLPDPIGDDYYEGWLVKRDPLRFISTGRVERIEGIFSNAYISATDLSDYNNYVLTLEPNDGNPAPAEHIAVGLMK